MNTVISIFSKRVLWFYVKSTPGLYKSVTENTYLLTVVNGNGNMVTLRLRGNEISPAWETWWRNDTFEIVTGMSLVINLQV